MVFIIGLIFGIYKIYKKCTNEKIEDELKNEDVKKIEENLDQLENENKKTNDELNTLKNENNDEIEKMRDKLRNYKYQSQKEKDEIRSQLNTQNHSCNVLKDSNLNLSITLSNLKDDIEKMKKSISKSLIEQQNKNALFS